MRADLTRLSDAERRAVMAYRDALLQRLPTHVRRLIVYGSRARDAADPDSDLDVVVVIEGHDRRTPDGWRPAPFNDPVWQTIVDTACDVSLIHNLYISPVVLTEDRLTEEVPFIQAISSEGIEIWSRESERVSG